VGLAFGGAIWHHVVYPINVGEMIMSIHPLYWASTGIALCVGLSVLGAAWGIWTVGSSIMGSGAFAPRIINKMLISVVFCEVVAIYGVIMSIVFSTKIIAGLNEAYYQTPSAWFTALSIFNGGMMVGLCNMISGVTIGINGSGTAIASASNDSNFVKTLIVQIFSSVIGLFGLIAGLLMSNKASPFGASH